MAEKGEEAFSALEDGTLFVRKSSRLALSGGGNHGMSVAFKARDGIAMALLPSCAQFRRAAAPRGPGTGRRSTR
jgi:hypothetical protein